MKRAVLAAICVVLSCTGAAEARRSHHRHASASSREGRPAAWCGWWMRKQVGHDPGGAYNLARNWKNWGVNADSPGAGVIVVWPHHVGRIVGRAGGGRWIVSSGNDGHSVRTRPRSLAGAIAFRRGT